jgi:purine-binding chemotaxis protein CheW
MKETKAVEAVWRERAERLSERQVSAGPEQDSIAVLVLNIAEERYAIDLPDVAEVLPRTRPTPVPGVPAVFAGVINVHGEIRPVIDLRHLLGMDGVPPGDKQRLILLCKEGRQMGLQIDSVEQIRWIDSRDMRRDGNLDRSRYIKGSNQDLLMLLNTEALFAELRIGDAP